MSKTAYRVEIEKRVEKNLGRLPKTIRFRIRKAIGSLGMNPRPRGWKKIKKEDDIYRIWVGRSYRVFYKIDDEKRIVTITDASTREGAY